MSESSKILASSGGGVPPASSSGSSSSGGPDPHKDFASRPRVKKLLETYKMTADRSLMGPEASEEAFNQHKYYYNSPSVYKLPPDVELSKTSPPNDKDNSHEMSKPNRVDLEASKRLHTMQMAMAAAAAQAGLKGGGPAPVSPPPPELIKSGNSLVTLSRIDGNGYNDASSTVTDIYHPARSRSSGDRSGHLTGEMIRQINALQKQKSSFAASFADIQRQQLQMQATYERVLREKTYLKYNNAGKSSSSSTSVSVGPVFSARDRGQANLSETRLASRNIACFDVGGEKRCCLPQILNSVLDQVSLNAIHAACDELQIYCSTCTPEQLDVLKVSKIIPNTASQCGLITKSDAERLCSKLLDSRPPMASSMGFHATASPFSFRVQHECFGKCRGIVLPEAYTCPTARCIECLECEGLFCPAKFVCHSHQNRENRICHWGFDSANWRAYLHLADDYTENEQDKMAKTVADFKSRYTNGNSAPPSHKRKSEYNGGNNNSRDRSLEEKSPRSHHYDTAVKKPRTSEEIQMLSAAAAGDPYSLLLYQNWVASLSGNGNSKVHPGAALAALSNNYAQALKDGKSPMAPPPGFSPGMPPPRPSSSAGHNGGYHSHHRERSAGFEAKMISPHDSRYVKSSPLSENAESPSDRHAHSIESSQGNGTNELVSPTTSHHSRRPSKHGSTSLAEDILAIRAALEGASVSARERTLKTLERLTARLAMAESERDMALDSLKKLQRRYESKEEELHKKRAELREALRNDAVGGHGGASLSSRAEIEFTSQKFPSSAAASSALPKMDMKSPARVMEEKSCESSSSRSVTPPISASALHAANQAAAAAAVSIEESITKIVPGHLRRRSGTPASVKSRESEDFRERVMSMEAELRALREELSNRSSLASNTSSQATLKEKEEASSLPESEKQAEEPQQAEHDEQPPLAKKAKKEVAEQDKNGSSKLESSAVVAEQKDKVEAKKEPNEAAEDNANKT